MLTRSALTPRSAMFDGRRPWTLSGTRPRQVAAPVHRSVRIAKSCGGAVRVDTTGPLRFADEADQFFRLVHCHLHQSIRSNRSTTRLAPLLSSVTVLNWAAGRLPDDGMFGNASIVLLPPRSRRAGCAAPERPRSTRSAAERRRGCLGPVRRTPPGTAAAQSRVRDGPRPTAPGSRRRRAPARTRVERHPGSEVRPKPDIRARGPAAQGPLLRDAVAGQGLGAARGCAPARGVGR